MLLRAFGDNELLQSCSFQIYFTLGSFTCAGGTTPYIYVFECCQFLVLPAGSGNQHAFSTAAGHLLQGPSEQLSMYLWNSSEYIKSNTTTVCFDQHITHVDCVQIPGGRW